MLHMEMIGFEVVYAYNRSTGETNKHERGRFNLTQAVSATIDIHLYDKK